MASRRRFSDGSETAADVLGGGFDPSPQAVADQIYGTSAPASGLDTGRVVARPTPLMDVWPDLRQPRRVFPAAVRGNWAGDPQGIVLLLEKWERLVQRHLREGERLNVGAVLRGEDFIDLDTEKADAVVQAYVSLVELAISIQRDGLINPITVYEDGGRVNVLTGERRLTAYHMLRLYVDEAAWSKIPAQRVTYSVRQQVQENTARRDLNAVGLARCYALICMDIAAREKGAAFEPYHAMVADTPHGTSDRGFYAQISGTPYGHASEVMAALNVTHRSALSRYQDVLSLPDDAWVLADMNDWTIRECIDLVKPPSAKPEPESNVNRDLHLGAEEQGANVAPVQHFEPPAPARPLTDERRKEREERRDGNAAIDEQWPEQWRRDREMTPEQVARAQQIIDEQAGYAASPPAPNAEPVELPRRQLEFLIAVQNGWDVNRNGATRHALRGLGYITQEDDWAAIQLTPAGQAALAANLQWSAEASGAYDEDIPLTETAGEYVVTDESLLKLLSMLADVTKDHAVAGRLSWLANLTVEELFDADEDSLAEQLDDLVIDVHRLMESLLIGFDTAMAGIRNMREA